MICASTLIVGALAVGSAVVRGALRASARALARASAWLWRACLRRRLRGPHHAERARCAVAKPRATRSREEAIRFGALGAGVLFLLAVARGPAADDPRRARAAQLHVVRRRAPRARAPRAASSRSSACSRCPASPSSSCALCSVTSIMGGFGHDLKRKILGNNAHIVVDVTAPGGFGDWEPKLAAVRAALAKSGGGAATPVVGGEAMASSASNTAGALVRGIDPDTIGDVIDLKNNIEVGKLRLPRAPREARRARRPTRSSAAAPAASRTSRAPTSASPPTSIPSLSEFLKQNDEGLPRRHHRPRARQVAPRARRRRGHAALADGRARPDGGDAAHAASSASRPSSTAACTSTTRRTRT